MSNLGVILGFLKTIKRIFGVYMTVRNHVIANIPVRKGLLHGSVVIETSTTNDII